MLSSQCDSARINNCLRPSFMSAGAGFSVSALFFGESSLDVGFKRQSCADMDEDLNADVHVTVC